MSDKNTNPTEVKIEYFTRRYTQDNADYGHPAIPANTKVSFYGEYTCFYGRFVKVGYGGRTYYLKPDDLYKQVTRAASLTEPVTGCYAVHNQFGVLGLAARIMTDPATSDDEYWLAIDKDDNLRTIRIKDCDKLYQVLEVKDDTVTYCE